MDAIVQRPTVAPTPVEAICNHIGGVLKGRKVEGNVGITGITLRSHDVRPGDIFAALPGQNTHGAMYAGEAIENGAVALVTDPAGSALLKDCGVPVIIVAAPRSLLGSMADLVYGSPAAALSLAGVTGTNGKTTVMTMVAAALVAAGKQTGTLGTLGVTFNGVHREGVRTTPEAPDVHAILAAMAASHISNVVMEVSSIAVCEHRVDGLTFDVMGFTNLTQDHLDYHGDMETYFTAKAAMFTPDRTACGVISLDDEWGKRLVTTLRESHGVRIVTVSSTGEDADWRIRYHGMAAHIAGPNEVSIEMRLPMPGAVNAANTVMALAMADVLGLQPGPAAQAIGHVRVPGRCEMIEVPGFPMVIVDYAHTPDAIARMVELAREAVSGRVIVVLGAGGDRDSSKRPLMGAAAGMGDHVIVTDDNPRGEDPRSIRALVISGIGPKAAVDEIADRAEAITHAVNLAKSDDVVLVLGKGHESGQQVGETIYPFDDRDAVRAALGGTKA